MTSTDLPAKPCPVSLNSKVDDVIDKHHFVDQQIATAPESISRLLAAQSNGEERHAFAAGITWRRRRDWDRRC